MLPARTALSVNLNKVALLRNARDLDLPSVEHAARLCLEAGADGLTVHPRPDGRHIRPHDVPALAQLLAGHRAEFNIEGNPFAGAGHEPWGAYPGFVALVEEAAEAGGVDQCTLVPDAPGQRTSDHGWDLDRDGERLAPLVARLKKTGCRVALFMDPVLEAMARAAETGADRVELYTEPYAAAWDTPAQAQQLARYACAARAAAEAGLGVNAGHDLNQDNLAAFVAQVPQLLEVSIGHAFVSDALELGYAQTVRAYQRCIDAGMAARRSA